MGESGRLWRVSEVAFFLGISRQSVYTLIRKGSISALHIGPGKSGGIRILDEDLKAYIQKCRIQPRLPESNAVNSK